MKSFLSSLRQIDRTNRQASITRHWDSKLLITQTINNVSKSSTRQSSLTLAWLLRSAGAIACTLGVQLFDVPKSLAAGVTVSGQVFSDVNSNGSIDSGDSGIAGVAVVLRNTTTNTCQSVSTNSSGSYSFTSISAGNYEIIEAADQTTPTPQTCTPAVGKTLAQTIGKDPTNYASTTPNVIPITVGSSNLTAKNFGDHSATSLGNCPSPAYITQGTAASDIKLNKVNLADGALSSILNSDVLTSINGIGFNLVDGYIYGSQNASGNFNLLRTGLDGKLENLGNVLDVSGNITLQGGSFVGDVDQNGIFYSIQGTTVTAIDVNPNSPTFKRYLKTFTIASPLSGTISIQDIAISPIDSKVYTVNNTGTSHLYRYSDFSIVTNGGTATIEDLGELKNVSGGGNMASGAKGAIYFAADGTLYAYRNGNSGSNDGAIYALSTTNISTPPKFTTITTSATGVSLNDGARCMFAPAVVLPNTYTVSGTLYKDNNNNGANNSEPGLGANVTVSIYDDKNNNNIIDANEQITTTTSDASGSYTLSNLVAGTYKIKVDTSDVDIPSNYGLSTPNNLSVTVGTANITGKDFGFVIPQVVGFKSAKLTDSNNDTKINPGETVTWTIDYVNTGSIDVTNFQITDLLPTGVTKSGAVTLSVGGTGQATPTVNPGYTGTNITIGTTDTLFTAPITLKVGGMIKVTIPVTINSGISGILSNQSSGTATNLPTVGIKTDNAGVTADLPTTIQNSPYSVTVPAGSISQTTTTAIDPTTITVQAAVAESTILPISTTPGVCSIPIASQFANTQWAAPFASGNSYPFTTNISGYTNNVTYTNLSGTYDVDNNPYVYNQTYTYTANSGPLKNNIKIPFMGFAFDPIPGVDGINRYVFATPLTSSDAILISDIDNTEEIELRFYDASGNILSTSSWTGESIKATSPNPTATIGSNYIRIVNPAGGTANLADPTWMLIPPAGQNVARVELSQITRPTAGDYAITFVHGGCSSISGTVFNDTDSSKIQNGTEAGTNGGGLNAVLLNSSNAVVATTTVDSNGAYSFSNVSPATYTVLITTGTTATVTLPTNWVSTGENLNGTADSTVDSKLLNVVVGSSNVTGANFGIKQNPADVLLLKRITAINGLSTNPNDNTTSLTGVLVDAKWKAGYVVGAINGGPVKPGDTIEYTIYYLNNGGHNAKSARICDRLNASQTFQQNTYTTGAGMQVQIGGDRITNSALTLTNTSDIDGGQFVAATSPVTALPTNCNSVTGAPNNDYGAVILDLVTNPGSPNLTTLPGRTGQGTPNDSFGFWRFITKVNKVSP